MSKKSKPGDGSHGKGKKGSSAFDDDIDDGGDDGAEESSFFGRIWAFFRGLF